MDQRRNLAVVPPVSPTDEMAQWQIIERQADVLVKSGMLPKSVTTPAAAVAIMVLGRELGFERMQSFRLIDVINGKPTLNAGGMAAIVQNYCKTHGGYLRVVESTAERATIEFKRADWPEPHRIAFSIEDAKRANLTGKDTWKAYPQNMCYARAVANACRMGFPDVVAGIYDPEELGGVAEAMPISIVSVQPGAGDGEVIDAVSAPSDPTKAMRRLHAVGNDRGVEHDGLRAIAAFHFPIMSSLTELSDEQLTRVANLVETGSDDDLTTWLTDWLAHIEGATTSEQLSEVGQVMADRGISRTTHQHLFAAYNQRKIALSKIKRAEQDAGAALDFDHVIDGAPGADRHTA